MYSPSLHSVLRSLAAAAPATDDGELLRRFLGGEEEAFAELVRRHGRLVWAVCRHLSRSDAEADDAFQATFLVLFQNAAKIRDAGRLSAWLHGVAYRICAKARQAAKRRAGRERIAAAQERNGSAVADSAWDRALAAVHEEAGQLPEALRVPFVLCCLEGIGVSEAAAQLGWKLGTLSGRLTRAKDAVLARLDARGLTIGAVAGLGLAAPPASALAKAAALARAGSIVPNAILQLTQGVIGMNATSFKLLAAALLLTCGLGVGAGTGWVATADAQTQAKPGQLKRDASDDVKRLQEQADQVARDAAERVKRLQELVEQARAAAAGANSKQKVKDLASDDLLKEARARQEIERQREMMLKYDELLNAARKAMGAMDTARTAQSEYDFVPVSDMDLTKFARFLQEREARGWEFKGATPLRHDGKASEMWVFRRAAKGNASATAALLDAYYHNHAPQAAPYSVPLKRVKPEESKEMKPDEIRGLEAEIAALQTRLAALKAMKGTRNQDRMMVTIARKDLPLDPPEMTQLLLGLAAKKFKSAHFKFIPANNSLVLEGDKEVIDWATALIKKLVSN